MRAAGRRLGRLVGGAGRGPGAVRRRTACSSSAVPLSATRSGTTTRASPTRTLWPLYHDVIAPPRVPPAPGGTRTSTSTGASPRPRPSRPRPGATVWVHDYQLQLVPRHAARACAPTCGSASSTTSRSPATRSSPSCPWRRQIVEGLLGADLLGFQRRADATNFLRACRRAAGLATTRGSSGCRSPDGRAASVRAAPFPISIDAAALRRDRPHGTRSRRAAGRSATRLGDPEVVLLGRRPARLHQGDPAPAQGLRRAARRRAADAAGGRAGAGGQPEPGAGRAVPRAARRGRGDGRPDQRRATARSAARRSTTCTSPTRARRWRRCTWPPT